MKLKAFMKVVWEQKKYRTVFIICICVAVFLIGGAIAAKHFVKKPITASKSTTVTPAPTFVSPLNGLTYTDKAKATRHPLAVIIENHPDARPQSGLIKASIVYEAITEGGITRYLAIFGPTDADEVGPIRSARLFFMDWLKEYDAFFAHAGGNEDALANIDKYNIKDIPHSNDFYYRDSKGKNVASEHTLYSSTQKLYDYAASKKSDVNSSSYTALKFKVDGPATTPGNGLEINFSSASYVVRWAYDPNKNIYSRFLAGTEHKDRTTGEQIKANNVIVQTVERTLQPTGSYGSQNWVFKTVGDGKAVVYQDGKIIKGTWKKASLTDRTKFYDESGAEIQFNPGTTWYEIVPPEVTEKAI